MSICCNMTLVQCKDENVRANKNHPLDKNEPLHVYGAMRVFKVDGLAREAAKCKGNCRVERCMSGVCPGLCMQSGRGQPQLEKWLHLYLPAPS